MSVRPQTILRAAFLLSLVGAATLALGCDAAVWGNGEAASEARNLTGFTAVEVSAGIDIELAVTGEQAGPPQRTGGRAPVATLRCDANLIPRIATFVEAGTLHVRPTDDDIDLRPRTACVLEAATERVESIAVQGPSTIVAHGALVGLRHIDLEGPAELDADGIVANVLDVRIEGPGEIVLAGTADRLVFDLEGPVDVAAAELAARTVELDASGPVEADVHASEHIELDVEGPAEIAIYGHPRSRDIDTEGPVEVRFR